MDFLLDAARILNGEETAHNFTDDDGGSLKNLLVGSDVGRNAEVRTELVGNGAADLVP